MHPSVAAALPGFLKQYEGKVNYMYLDKKGLVTIGIGNLIDPVNQALKLEFGPKGGGGTVSGAEVIAEFQTVKGRKDLIDKPTAEFDKITSLQLTDAGIATMVASHANAIEGYIKTNASAKLFYADFDAWPAEAQLGFFGVAWGGIPLPQFGWNLFPPACRDQDWDKAAAQCKISSPIAAGRNEAHRLMFLNAAAIKTNGDDITKVWWPIRIGRTVKPTGD